MQRATDLIEAAGLPKTMPNISSEVMLSHMQRDKKNENGNIRLILLDAIGASNVNPAISTPRLRQFLDSRTLQP